MLGGAQKASVLQGRCSFAVLVNVRQREKPDILFLPLILSAIAFWDQKSQQEFPRHHLAFTEAYGMQF